MNLGDRGPQGILVGADFDLGVGGERDATLGGENGLLEAESLAAALPVGSECLDGHGLFPLCWKGY